MSVTFGSESPTAQNVTATSLDVQVGPQPAGTKTVTLTRSNGEKATASFSLVATQPAIASLSPSSHPGGAPPTAVTVTGSGFLPGLAVSFGSQNPVPQNLTPTSFDVAVGPQPVGPATVTVSYPSGKSASRPFDFAPVSIQSVIPPLAAPGSLVTITGTGFVPGLAVAVGSQNPTPQNLTPTSFQVNIGPQAPGEVTIAVSYPGNSDSATLLILDAASPKVALVTSQTYTSNLGGLSGADAKCNALASAASLPGSYLAWLGDDTGDPQSRFSKNYPYRLVNGTSVATSFYDLVADGPAVGIDVNESGVVQGSVGTVWTGVGADGFHTGNDCSDWTNAGAAGTVAVGSAVSGAPAWTQLQLVGCGGFERRLYCFEQ